MIVSVPGHCLSFTLICSYVQHCRAQDVGSYDKYRNVGMWYLGFWWSTDINDRWNSNRLSLLVPLSVA